MRFASPAPRLLSGAVLLAAGIVLTILQFVFLRGAIPFDGLRVVSHATRGLVRPTLLANLAIAFVVVGIVLVGFGRQRPRDLALPGRVAEGIGITALVWIVVNALEACVGWRDGDLAFDRRWAFQPAALLGQWMAVTFGTALLEEILFRGVLLRQLFLRLAGRSRSVALIAAIAGSAALFAASHLPALVVQHAASGSALQDLFVAGCALALLFVVTGNLALCIGIHGLADAPTLLVVDRWDLLDHQTFVIATCVVLSAATLVRERLARR